MTIILVVDDETSIRRLICDVLEEEGYFVIGASNGRMALDVITAVVPDLIITDIMMPLMDGIELCATLQTKPTTAQIPLIMMSAGIDRPLAVHCDRAAFLKKPFQVTTVVDMVKVALKQPS